MNTLTTWTIRADFETQIKGISPSFALHQDRKWVPVESAREVEGAEVRRFYLMITPGTADGDLYGNDGISKTASLRVYTSYTRLTNKELDGMIDQDESDLYLTLERRTSPTLSGLLPPRSEGWFELNDQEGAVWGYHQFSIQYNAAGTI